MAAAHLINRLPVSLLNNQTPFSILHNHPPSYSHLRVLGYLAFASKPLRITDKFTPRGVRCLFIGYPATQKGYKLYNLVSHKTFVSRDVRFREHSMPYKLFATPSAPVPNSLPSPSILIQLSTDVLPSTNSSPSCTDHSAALPASSTSDPNLRRSFRPRTTPSWHTGYAIASP